jgi:N-formylglutamate deformylase
MKLPFVISLPHCSDRIPRAERGAISLSDQEIYASKDVGTWEIFGLLPARVILCAPWSRILVDLNRGAHHGGAKGVIPKIDYHGRPVYRAGMFPGEHEVGKRLRDYYRPYHDRLKKAMERPDIQGLVDCHSLSRVGPPASPDRGKTRKDIVLSNNGNQDGEPDPALGATSCPADLLHLMGRAFQKTGFSVAINDPYSGGHILKHHGREAVKKGKIALQIEINQDLFVDSENLQIVTERLEGVRATVIQCMISSMIRMTPGVLS